MKDKQEKVPGNRPGTRKIVNAYLKGKLPASLAMKIRAWLLVDNENRAGKDAALEEAWHRAVRYEKRPGRHAREAFEETRARLFPGETRRRRIPGWRRVAAAAAVSLFAAGGVTWLVTTRDEGTRETIAVVETSGDSTRQVLLPDGTNVILNARGALAYDDPRAVTLDGEALFEVVKGERPFVVTAGDVVVTVLGTTFNVEAFPGSARLKVTVFEGKVRVEGKGWSRVTRAGEELLLDLSSGERRVAAVDTTVKRPAWCAPSPASLTVSRFSDILSMIADRHGVSIENKRPGLNDDLYTFSHGEEESLEEALRALQSAGERFTYTIKDGVVTIE
ncbi:MAG: FecR domain-containing protein [Odoribacteraceae bacterium]|jgi:ferric-dicitrate binding protein FerR (iron transport regulator)|nr:FecR domain-containing protein [Odoribacteraceae bacterium]